MRYISRRLSWVILGASILFATSVEALPEFARRTGISCTGCHDAWPRLNDFGELYRDRGYRIGNVNDNDWGKMLQSFPISFRSTPGYQFTSTTNQPTDQGTQTIHSGSFQFPSADLYFGGAMSDHVSAYADLSGFSADRSVAIESGWIRFNEIGTSWLNLKVGKQELDLPFSMHRAHTIYAPLLIYGYHPGGSANPFTLNINQLAVEVSGHQEHPGFRYSIALASSNDLAGSWLVSAPTVYSHLTQTFLLRSEVVPRIRIGVVGDLGWTPTQFQTLTPTGGTAAPISGTGLINVAHGHLGGDLQVSFLSLSQPITLTGGWLYGQDDKALIPNGTQDAQFHGGFVQLDYIPTLSLIVGVRYDGVYNLQQGDPTQPLNSNQQDGFSLFARYAVWMSAWGSAMVHIEASTVNTQNVGAVAGSPARTSFLFAGVDFLL